MKTPLHTMEHTWETALHKRQEDGLLRVVHHERTQLLDFTSNDYLQLSQHPTVIQGAIDAVQAYGTGKCSSRLISGGYDLLDTLEKELAQWYGKEEALLFPSGYQANCATLSTLLNAKSLVIADKYVHRSIIDGIKLSQAQLIRYPHGNLQAMQALLQKHHQAPHIVCITESVFSMHGTSIDEEAFCAIAAQYGALSYIDDAHGFGVLSKDEKERCKNCDIIVTTLSKGLGAQGGVCLSSKTFIQYLINMASGFIYTTSICPAIVGGALAALRLLPTLRTEKAHLHHLIAYWKQHIAPSYTHSTSTTQIQPIIIGDSKQAIHIQAHLHNLDIATVAIRPPTVPAQQAMLRCSLSTAHSTQSIDLLFKILQDFI